MTAQGNPIVCQIHCYDADDEDLDDVTVHQNIELAKSHVDEILGFELEWEDHVQADGGYTVDNGDMIFKLSTLTILD